jgi:hypothetical protein
MQINLICAVAPYSAKGKSMPLRAVPREHPAAAFTACSPSVTTTFRAGGQGFLQDAVPPDVFERDAARLPACSSRPGPLTRGRKKRHSVLVT